MTLVGCFTWTLVVSRFAVSLSQSVLSLTTATFDAHLRDNRQTMIEFYAPWCGHCKKLAPEYEKAAKDLAPSSVRLGQVDATEEKEIATRYNVKGFPTLMWFEDGQQAEYDGGRTAEGIVEWVTSMTGPAVIRVAAAQGPTAGKPEVVLYADRLFPGFEAAAKANRRKGSWAFVETSAPARVVISHKGEEPLTIMDGCDRQERVDNFFKENAMPLFGRLDGDTFDKYMESGNGLVWGLFKMNGKSLDDIERENRPMMTEVAKRFKGTYHFTYTDSEKFKEAVDNMLSVSEFPAIAVQKKAGDKKKYVHQGEMSAAAIGKFMDDVIAGRVERRLKSEPVPPARRDSVTVVVGKTLEAEAYTPDKDVLLEVYAPWCGHCKKLEPEYLKLAKKIEKEELTDLIKIAKIDGTANDSPVDSLEWTGFPTIYFFKAGNPEPMTYDGERTAKGLYKYIKKHATKAQEIKERLEKRRRHQTRAGEL